jgi:ribonuclease BN (tRNA processing enzyme)
MKITFAGVGGAFCGRDQYQSNMLITSETGKHLLLDCGTHASFSFGELGATNQNLSQWADAVYVSHLHSDHIGGLEWLAFSTLFSSKPKKPKLFIVDTLIDSLWCSLKGGIQSIEGSSMQLSDFFDIRAIQINSSFDWEGIQFKPVQTVHIMDGTRIIPSYGLLITHDANSLPVFVTTDTQFCPRQIECFYNMSSVIFHDCETTRFRSGVHAHYEDLVTLPLRHKEKMWLYHYNPDHAFDAKKDGFRGFVKKGDSFVTKEGDLEISGK